MRTIFRAVSFITDCKDAICSRIWLIGMEYSRAVKRDVDCGDSPVRDRNVSEIFICLGGDMRAFVRSVRVNRKIGAYRVNILSCSRVETRKLGSRDYAISQRMTGVQLFFIHKRRYSDQL